MAMGGMSLGIRSALSLGLMVLLTVSPAVVVVDAGSGHATFYGGSDASGTNDGACGYSNVFSLGYGTMTTALSAPLFNDGQTCGACFQVTCYGSAGCYSNSITVTATNLCPQGSYGGWCDQPKQHFDLSAPAFAQIAQPIYGGVPINFQQVSCKKSGGIRFYVQGHTYYLLVLVYNVGGAGSLNGVSVKGNGNWINMGRTWGVNYATGTVLDGQPLSFQVVASDGRSLQLYNVAGQSWGYYQTYASNLNF